MVTLYHDRKVGFGHQRAGSGIADEGVEAVHEHFAGRYRRGGYYVENVESKCFVSAGITSCCVDVEALFVNAVVRAELRTSV
jgi:hypothetical protein